MKFHTSDNTIRILFFFAAVLALALTPAHWQRAGAQGGPCSCDDLAACGGTSAGTNGSQLPVVKSPRAVNTVKPAEYGAGANKIKFHAPVMDEDLPGLDKYTGTSGDDELGRAGPSGHFAQRRRQILNQLNTARQAQANGGFSQENFAKLKLSLTERLAAVNNEEFEAAQASGAGQGEMREAKIKELEGRVNAENERKTDEAMLLIESMDLNSFAGQFVLIRQAVSDNLAQARALELFGRSGAAAQDRARRIADKLLEKIAKDCQSKKLSPEDVAAAGRLGIMTGSATEESIKRLLERCAPRPLVARPGSGSRTLIARADFNGIEYEATRCIGGQSNRASLEGEWHIAIAGQMQGSGSAQIGSGGAGTWNGKATVGGEITITMQGPAEIISSGGQCVLRIKAATATGQVMGQTVTMPGVSGDLPIRVLDQACTAK